MKRKNPVDRFYGKWIIDKQTGCWNWTGNKVNGYGRLSRNHEPTNLILAHRLSYLLFYGPITEDMDVCHKCDNPGCVNPEHLFLGTAKTNISDSIKKKRFQKGERNGLSLLTNVQAEQIRDFVLANGMSNKFVAEVYQVNRSCVSRIKTGKIYVQ